MLMLFAAPILLGLVSGLIARSKGYSMGLWWLYGLFLPIFAIPHALILRPDSRSLRRQQIASGKKECPECAELVLAQANVCRFCGHKFADHSLRAEPYLEPPRIQTGKEYEAMAAGLQKR